LLGKGSLSKRRTGVLGDFQRGREAGGRKFVSARGEEYSQGGIKRNRIGPCLHAACRPKESNYAFFGGNLQRREGGGEEGEPPQPLPRNLLEGEG